VAPSKASVAGSLLSLIGDLLLVDDAHDLFKFKYFGRPFHKDHPSFLHHWQYGLIMSLIGEIMQAIGRVDSAMKYYKQKYGD